MKKQSVSIRKQKISGLRTGEKLNRVAFPMGGIGAGMLSLEGTGALSQVSLRHKPDVYHEPQVFAALHVNGAATARVLEGPVPMWKILGSATGPTFSEPGNGLSGRTYAQPPHAEGGAGGGGSLYVPFTLKSKAEKTIRLRLAWHVSRSTVGVRKGKPFVEVASGTIVVKRIAYKG